VSGSANVCEKEVAWFDIRLLEMIRFAQVFEQVIARIECVATDCTGLFGHDAETVTGGFLE